MADVADIPRPQTNLETIDVLKSALKRAESGELLEVVVLGVASNDNLYDAWSTSENVYSLAGFMIHTALRRMGFIDTVQFNRLVK